MFAETYYDMMTFWLLLTVAVQLVSESRPSWKNNAHGYKQLEELNVKQMTCSWHKHLRGACHSFIALLFHIPWQQNVRSSLKASSLLEHLLFNKPQCLFLHHALFIFFHRDQSPVSEGRNGDGESLFGFWESLESITSVGFYQNCLAE